MKTTEKATLLEKSEGNVVGFKLRGHITVGDMMVVLPELDRVIEQYGSVRVLIVLEEVEGVSPVALWEELKFDLAHLRKYKRLALVGDRRWQKALIVLSKPFVDGEVQYFPRESLDEAWAWVKSH